MSAGHDGSPELRAEGTRVLVATRNPGKLRELLPLVAPSGWGLVTLDEAGVPATPEDEAVECHDTFEANALAKARHYAARSGLPTLSDDSGLEVDALGGAPGVHSRRWSGAGAGGAGDAQDAANLAMLLERLADARDRAARFVCAAAWTSGEQSLVRTGTCEGRIALVRSRGAHGFGYDPVFIADELGVTFADASAAAKARVSHRARAFAALLAALRTGEA